MGGPDRAAKLGTRCAVTWARTGGGVGVDREDGAGAEGKIEEAWGDTTEWAGCARWWRGAQGGWSRSGVRIWPTGPRHMVFQACRDLGGSGHWRGGVHWPQNPSRGSIAGARGERSRRNSLASDRHCTERWEG